MSVTKYPSFGEALVLAVPYLLIAAFAGLPGFIPYLIWKNDFTLNIGYICAYIAAFGLTIRKAILTIRRSGDKFSLSALYKKDTDWLQVVLLIFLTLTIGICIDYLILFFRLPDFFESDMNETLKYPLVSFFQMAILPALLEEILFRGIILERFLMRYTARTAVLLSALLFGIMHLNPSQILAGFIAGCFLGFVYIRTRSIKYCILIHFVNNSLAWLEHQLNTYYPDTSFNTFLVSLDTNFPIFFISLIVSVAVLFLLNKRYAKTGV